MIVLYADIDTPRLTHRQAREAIHRDIWFRPTDHRVLGTHRVDDQRIRARVRVYDALLCEQPCRTLGPDYFKVFDHLDYRVTVKIETEETEETDS